MARQNINIGTSANDGTGDKLRVAFDKVNDNFIELYELGDKGSKGDIGAQGVQGAIGEQGVQGAQGQKGEPSIGGSGAQGEQGFQGVQGAQGIQGEPGIAGSKGEKGDIGEQGVQGEIGAKGEQGVQGAQGIAGVGEQGVQGEVGAQGFQGVQGDIGAQGVQGDIGAQGVQGDAGSAGPQGAQGRDGNFGGATLDYTFNNNTSNTDPGTGFLRFNNANLTLATKLYIDNLDDNATNAYNFLLTIDDSTSTIKGHFRVTNKFDDNDFALYTISSLKSHDSYFEVDCAYVSGSSESFSNNDDLLITFARTGDRGDQGFQGVQGEVGTKGEQGVQGASGSGASLPLANGTSNVDIALANGYVTVTANTYTWTFNETNGLLELAGDLANFSACSAINFVANSSGDGNGYSTIELRPDSNATNDQYLIIDPTAPSHIHIRAGGQQDNSNAEIYLGGENSYFKVNDGENPSTSIASNGYTWTFNTDGTITFPDTTVQTVAYTGTDIITVKKVFETTSALSAATGVVTHNCDNGHIFVHSSISANFTANFINTTIASNTATAFTLVLNQGATAYVANAVQIGGVAQTVNWLGSSTAPGGNANKKDIISFSVVNNNGTWITLGQLTSFG